MKILLLAGAMLLALYTAAPAKTCRLVSEPKRDCAISAYAPSGHYVCNKERCVELVALPETCLTDRIACDGDLPKEARE